MLKGGMLGCWSCLALTCVLVEPPPIQRPKAMTPPAAAPLPEPTPTPEPTPEPIAPAPTTPAPTPAPSVTPEPPPPEPAPTVAPQRPRALGSPPVLPPEPGAAIAPSEHADPVATVEPPRTTDPFAGSPPPPVAPDARRRVVDPFTDAPPEAPTRDGKALLYGGLAFTAITIAVRVPVSTKLMRVGNPYDAMVYGNIVNLAATGAVATLVVGAVRRGRAVAYEDVFEHKKRRFKAKAFTATGWTMFGVGLGAFVLSRVLTPLSCDLVNQCSFGGLEATWYASFALVAAGAAIGSFGIAYGERASAYEQKHIAFTPWIGRQRAGFGISGRF